MLKIVTGKNTSVLRRKAETIKETPDIASLAEKMKETMEAANGIGLAAPQVGRSIQLFVVDKLAFDEKLSKWEFKKIASPDVSEGFAFINPSIKTYPKGKKAMREGCLSLPGWEGIVSRPPRITIKAQTLNGEWFKLQAKGLLAQVLQHEYDHLQGVLICDKWKQPVRIKKHELRSKNIVFFGSSDFSDIVLHRLKETPFEPGLIIRNKEDLGKLKGEYGLGIVAWYGGIIPTQLIRRFRYGILNVHPSLLPRHRGPSPVQAAILQGDILAGVSVIIVNERVDAGDIIAQEEVPLTRKYTTPELYTILFTKGAKLLMDVLPQWIEGVLLPKKQDEAQSTVTRRIQKEDGLINWSESAELIERKIRAYLPWPGAYTFFEHKGKKIRLHLLEADVIEESLPHTVYGSVKREDKELIIFCARGSLLVKKLLPEGKRAMTGEEFLRGYSPTRFFQRS